MTIGADELERLLRDHAVSVLDVRTRAEYEGQAGYPCDPRQGHIEGAVQLDWEELYAAPGRPHDAATLERVLADAGAHPERPLVVYCHSGQRSALAAVALRSAGFDVRNYEGSWHEWSRRTDGS